MICYFNYTDTPIGFLSIAVDENAVKAISFRDVGQQYSGALKQETPLINSVYSQLKEYFAVQRKEFNLPLAPEGTDFQQKVWQALCQIPYGETRSYKEIAVAAGSPKGYRAVGLANNRNPIAIIIPCHRVIGADGKMVGYGGGLAIKEKLLQIEKALLVCKKF